MLALVVTAAIARLGSPTPSPEYTSSARSVAPGPTPLSTNPPIVGAASDTFDGWTVAVAGGSTTFRETENHHSGYAALQIVRPPGDAPAGVPSISQTVTVAQDSRVAVSFWASSDGSPSADAVEVRVGGSTPSVLPLPAGAFSWTRFAVEWTVPPGVTSAPITIAAPGATPGTRLDDFSVQGQGSSGVVMENPAFELSSAPVEITNSSLVLEQSSALHLTSRLSPAGAFAWSAQEYTGGEPVRGRGRFVDGQANLPLASFATGYYTLTLQVTVGTRHVTRSTDLVVTTAVPAVQPTPLLGVGVHLSASDPQLDQKLADIASLGIRAARTDADWTSVEQRAGQYDFSGLDPVVAAMERHGIRPLLIPDYRNPLYDGGRTPSSAAAIAAYARFAAAVAATYPGADIDVYNEFDWRFNSSSCGKTPQCYLSLLRPTSAAVKAAGTTAAVAGPDISGTGVQQDWLNGFIAGGGLGLVDAVDFHPYVQPDQPDVLESQLDGLRSAMTSAGGATKPIWFTEFGDATMAGWVSERQQAEDAARVFGVAAAHGVTRIYWYDDVDDGPNRTNQEDNFGLFRDPDSLAPQSYVPKPAAAVLATADRMASGLEPVPSSAVPSPVRSVAFAGAGARSLLCWTPDAGGTQPLPTQGSVTSMTGRALPRSRSEQVGSDPVWVRARP